MAGKEKKNEPVSLSSPVTRLAGVGPAKAAAYAKLGVSSVADLLYHVPRSYENRGDLRTLADSHADGGKTAVILTVGTAVSVTRLKGRMVLLKFRAFDETGTCEITYFNQPYLRDVFTLGSEFRFYGKVERKPLRSGTLYLMSSPAHEPWNGTPLPDFTSVYPLAEGLTQKNITQNIAEALRISETELCDPLPEEIRAEHHLCTLAFALRNIHDPHNYEDLNRAKKRLVFEEFFTFSLIMAHKRARERSHGAFPCTKQNISPLLRLLPYELTGAQKRAITEIAADMKTDIPMNRIVIGDVGCGKTVVAAAAICIAVMSGKQAALMAPTEILARQHFEDLGGLFARLGIRCELLVGATTAAEKRRIREGLISGDPDARIQVVIGTHALISAGVEYADLALVVTDEQHRFGVNQRAALAQKAEFTHVLAMSATPIPRSLALVLYGDTDISKIDEMPAGRQRVETFVVGESYRERINRFIQKTCAEGGQVYVVCPSIEEEADGGDSGEFSFDEITDDGIRQKPPLKAAVEYSAELQRALPELTVGFIHGRMKAEQKEAVMTSFAAGDIHVLVSTTVIEVGVNVPNASLMIVENAERFGLSQLHQLRGRVGRGRRKSTCILISDDENPTARHRLSVMRETYDGFAIAEADLETRGPGDFFSKTGSAEVRQSGGLRFRFANLCGDTGLFNLASEAARKLLEADPELEAHPELRRSLARLTDAG